MQKLKIFLSVISSLFIALALSYGLVFAGPTNVKDSISATSNNIFLNSENLYKNTLTLISSYSASSFSVSGDCLLNSRFLDSNGEKHYFEVSFLDKNCSKNKVDVIFKNNYKTLNYSFNLIKSYDLYNKYLDYSTEDLEKIYLGLKEEIKNFDIKNADDTKKRSFEELKFFENFFAKILENRKLKYSVPVIGATKMTRETKVPNSGRPYRNGYTDGIHHGWDFDYKMGTEVVAIDDGIIIRIVKDFKNSDFGKIKRTGNLTETDKMINLDILRGNQVWLKTMKGDVIFYSHLDKVPENLKVGDIVSRNQVLGTIGVTGVPEEGYSDYHLHMDVKINPLDTSKAGTYTFIDMMAWPWSYKGQTAKYALEKQTELFDFK